MAAEHRFLRFILPARAFATVERGTHQWLIECTCGQKRDDWEAGGVRHKGLGEPQQLRMCETCQRARWHKLRRKTPQEAAEL